MCSSRIPPAHSKEREPAGLKQITMHSTQLSYSCKAADQTHWEKAGHTIRSITKYSLFSLGKSVPDSAQVTCTSLRSKSGSSKEQKSIPCCQSRQYGVAALCTLELLYAIQTSLRFLYGVEKEFCEYFFICSLFQQDYVPLHVTLHLLFVIYVVCLPKFLR